MADPVLLGLLLRGRVCLCQREGGRHVDDLVAAVVQQAGHEPFERMGQGAVDLTGFGFKAIEYHGGGFEEALQRGGTKPEHGAGGKVRVGLFDPASRDVVFAKEGGQPAPVEALISVVVDHALCRPHHAQSGVLREHLAQGLGCVRVTDQAAEDGLSPGGAVFAVR